MNIREKRAFVANAYPGPGWHRRVENMSDEQVVAIFLELMMRDNQMVPEPEPNPQLRLF